MSDTRLDKDNIILESNVCIGTNTPVRQFHVEGIEIHSSGSGTGFSFSDRTQPGSVEVPTKDQRWVWYGLTG